ncbi:hypothetical protein RRG08_014247 [Elysia crispata]|uniref:Uncharacterized protein n=1 Tax=Elysia crispata TaxID=231223 RepID=A0AAE0XEZ0_9GAST|nr:hypothetical protein RRG08_014247 [Elysia crispata]
MERANLCWVPEDETICTPELPPPTSPGQAPLRCSRDQVSSSLIGLATHLSMGVDGTARYWRGLAEKCSHTRRS